METSINSSKTAIIYKNFKGVENMTAETITQIWQHNTSGETFAVKVYDQDTVREFWGPLSSDETQQVIDIVRDNGNWTGEYEGTLQSDGYDAAEMMLAGFAETAGEYRVTWTEK